MEQVLFFMFAILAACYAAYVGEKTRVRGLEALEYRLKNQQPDIKYDFNKFNTKKHRNSELKLEKDRIILNTDIQSIQIANDALLLNISSALAEDPIRFDIVIQPFTHQLLLVDGYHHFSQEGVSTFWGRGIETFNVYNYLIQNYDLPIDLNNDVGNFFLKIASFNSDSADNQIIINGEFADKGMFKIKLDYKTFRLGLEAAISSLSNAANFTSVISA